MKNESLNKSGVKRKIVFRWSIKTKLTIVFLALAIIPMAFITYYNLTQARGEVLKVARENLIELSRSTSQQIGLLLIENQRTSSTLAGEPSVVSYLAGTDKERRGLTSKVYKTLQNFADNHPDYDAPGLLDVNGIVLVSLDERLVGKNRSFRDYFQASIRGESYISSMLIGRTTGRPGVFLTHPVITAEDEIVGIDIVWLKGNAIWSIVDDIMMGDECCAYLIDEDGVIIAHTNRQLLYHSIGELTPKAIETISTTIRFGILEGTDNPYIPKNLGMDSLALAVLTGTTSGTSRYHSPLDHREHIIGYTRIEAHPWTVVVDLPVTQFLAPLRRLGIVSWTSVALVGLIALLISILLARSITRPICSLTEAAIAVKQNRLFEPLDIKGVTSGSNEIAHLGQVFSSMVVSLRKEIYERKQAEERIQHLNSVLKAIRNVNQMISVEKDRERLLQKTCDVLIETRDYDAVWLGFLRDDKAFEIVVGSGFREDVKRFCEYVIGGKHPQCIKNALVQKDKLLILYKSRECRDCLFKNACTGKVTIIIRLEHANRLFGLLAISLASDIIAGDEEKGLLKEVAGDIAFALYNLELEEASKRAEEALRESENRFKTLFEEAPDPMYTHSMKGEFIDGNKAAEKLVGYNREELIGKNILKAGLVPKKYLLYAVKLLAKSIAGKKTGPDEIELIHKDGKKVFVEINSLPIKLSGKRTVLAIVRDITERKKVEEQIQRDLREKEILLQEIHHRVKNNLQIISSLLNLQSRYIKDEQSLELFRDSQNRIRSMALIHERLYRSKDLARIPFAEYIKKLASGLYSVYGVDPGRVVLKIETDDVSLGIDQAIPCGLIINELVSNSLKHAFPETWQGKAEIKIALHQIKRGKIELIVSDNGVGIPEELDFMKTESLGLNLVTLLAEEQLEGKVKLDRKEGTRFQIKFKKGE